MVNLNRVEALKQLCGEYIYKRPAQSLTEAEFDEMVAFAEDNADLGHLEFEYAVNRWHLDDVKKPKNLSIMTWLLISANSRVHVKPRNAK